MVPNAGEAAVRLGRRALKSAVSPVTVASLSSTLVETASFQAARRVSVRFSSACCSHAACSSASNEQQGRPSGSTREDDANEAASGREHQPDDALQLPTCCPYVLQDGSLTSLRTARERGKAWASSDYGSSRLYATGRPGPAAAATAHARLATASVSMAVQAALPRIHQQQQQDAWGYRKALPSLMGDEKWHHPSTSAKTQEVSPRQWHQEQHQGSNGSMDDTPRDALEPSEPILWHPKRAPGRLPPHVTFYKRELAPPCIAFSSAEGKRLWTEALLDGSADCYFKLSEQFITQAEPAYCGLTSLAMVLNTLEIDPRRTWKGVWRWFVEDMVVTYCGEPLENVEESGVTFAQVVDLARCNGAAVDVLPYSSLTLERFREVIASVCAQDEKFLIVSYSRRALNQSGDGHFSPVGGYNAKSDSVLILDVARFKYPPHWVPVKELYAAMSHHDPETGKPRGAMLLSRSPHANSVLFTVETASGEASWQPLKRFVEHDLPRMAAERITAASGRGKGGCSLAFNLPQLLASMVVEETPRGVAAGLSTRLGPSCTQDDYSCSHHQAMQQLLVELRALPLYKAIKEQLSATRRSLGDNFMAAERLLLVLLLAPASTWDKVPPQYRAAVVEMLNPSSGKWALKLVAAEVEFLRAQLDDLVERRNYQ